MVTATLYIEGGGEGKELRVRFREGRRKFLNSAGVGGRTRVLEALGRATASCRKSYSKGKVSFELLAQVDPARVEAACPHAKAFLNGLRGL